MIACDLCDEWFHGKCVGISHKQAEKITKYICDTCRTKTPHSTNDNNESTVKQNKCSSRNCFNLAKSNSKYCSDECGIKTAKEALKQKEINQKLNQLSNIPQDIVSGADAEDQRLLDAVAKRKQQLESNILEVNEQEKELERHISYSQTLFARDPVAAEASTDLRLATLEIVDCITCSQPIPAKNYAKHVQQCFVKVSGTTVKNPPKENQLCGCQTTEFPSGYCERLKKSCIKHVDWENVRKKQLQADRQRHLEILKKLEEEQRMIQLRISRKRSTHNETNRTIVEA